ncbi:adenosine deaminase [Mesorhizobium sp. 8]|uniref:adenosine deaminase n=1 Tax=Mesorhizobium sp. 8 TaxID=2584466 RepID=UPI00111D75CC|nr:adenosine deaminase [Mesorhizobium sp. 8]QDC00644.1 adenosine deaminase [Mesorhizobium sp. 8]
MPLKAELHCHIEGAAHPDLVLRQARKYDADPSPFIRDGAFVWHDFTSFLAAYDFSASLFRSEEDYALLADYYLTSLARDGAIYSEIFISPDHAAGAGLSAKAYTDALGEGIARAMARTGIEGRMIVVGLRHAGVEAVEKAARFAARCGNALVTGFGMAGDERVGDLEDYVRAFEIAREAGLGITVHAGELVGWESVAAALDHIRPARIGHGVRAVENPNLVRRIAEKGVVLECCPGSNIALGVFPDFAGHPLPELKRAGCKVTLNSDDPPYFHTSLKREYDIGREHFSMDDKALTAITRTAIEAAFVDRKTKAALLVRLGR